MNKLFQGENLDFRTIFDNPDLKEDSVREVIILPILKQLGYTQQNIVRSKALQHPFLKIGSQKRPINIVPDYSLFSGICVVSLWKLSVIASASHSPNS